MKNNEKGITLVALIALVSVLIILAGITLTEIGRSKDNTKIEVAESELKIVQNAVLQRKTESELTMTNYADLPGDNISKDDVSEIAKGIELKGVDGEYKELNTEKLEELGITNTKDTYIVNYNTGEVINKDKFDKYGKELYIYSVNN